MNNHVVLLITDQSGRHWHLVTRKALGDDWRLDVSDETQWQEYMSARHYSLVILDAVSLPQAPDLTRQIMSCFPGHRVAVASAVPTWRQALDVFKAGAIEYFYKTVDAAELHVLLHALLEVRSNMGELNGQSDATSR